MAPKPLVTELGTVSMDVTFASDVDTNSSISFEVSSQSDSSDEDWSDLLGSDWRGFSSSLDSSDSSTDLLLEFGSDEEMPELHPPGYPESDDEDEDERSVSESSASEAGDDADDEEGWDDGLNDIEDFAIFPTNNPTRLACPNLENMDAHRYDSRDAFPCGPAFLRHGLGTMKDNRADHFWQELRLSLFTFDKLVQGVGNDPIFSNDSKKAQMWVEDQSAITSFCLGLSGNAAIGSPQRVANWAGVVVGSDGRDMEFLPWPPSDSTVVKPLINHYLIVYVVNTYLSCNFTIVPPPLRPVQGSRPEEPPRDLAPYPRIVASGLSSHQQPEFALHDTHTLLTPLSSL
ncbi:DDE Tnp4 domain-containing protein [Mycena venus]|uniref:DDE Tnp4 domain-containing protein n=1 Tax=Mycena venus TaxID=2733690 RepID=A0A8H7DG91_9AGAR|nr:DDE Tnp4 domain-containing protein [Mycena venus]